MTTRLATRLSALITLLFSFALTTSASAAAITVNNLADDVFVNAAGAIFSDAAYTTPVTLTGAKCTLRMALAAANTNTAIGGANGCASGSGTDIITIGVNGTIKLSQVSMEPAPFAPSGAITWLLFAAGNVSIIGAGSGSLTINGGGLSPGPAGLRALVISNNDALTDAPATVSGLSFKEGRSLATVAAGGGAAGGCVFSRESLTLTDIAFDSCETSGAGDGGGSGAANVSTTGGALAMGVPLSTDLRPNATLNNVRFTNNRTVHGTAGPTFTSAGGGATFGNGSSLWVGAISISNSQFMSNTSESVGGLRITGALSVSISDTDFLSNSATSFNDGGFLISSVSGTVTMNGSSVVGNTAALRRGGGQIATVGASLTPADEVITLNDVSFVGNVASGQDIGGLSILTDTFDNVTSNCNFGQLRSVRLTEVRFRSNVAAQNRGGLRVGCSANLTLLNGEFSNNRISGDSSASSGGNSAAQLHDLASVTMDNISIHGNQTYAGSIAGGYGVFTITGHPSSNSVPLIFPSIGATHAMTATNIRVRDNFAQSTFPGLWLRANGAGRNYSVSNSSFTGNTSNNSPYGMFFETVGNYSISNSTFSGNYSLGGGGPALGFNSLAPSGTLQVLLENVTSARNGPNSNAFDVATYGGSVYSANVVVRNSILGQYQFGTGPGISYNATAGLTYSFVNSIVEAQSGFAGGICNANGVLCGVDAKIEGLNYNGGNPGTFTHALRAGSPALNAGVAVAATTDQRGAGFPRVIGAAVDMGAYESNALATVLPCKLDMDNDGFVKANKEGLVLLRSMLGFSGAPVVAGTGISQGDWDAARNNLNANCGTSLTP